MTRRMRKETESRDTIDQNQDVVRTESIIDHRVEVRSIVTSGIEIEHAVAVEIRIDGTRKPV